MTRLDGSAAAFTSDQDKELILRFFAIYNNLNNFKPPQYKFLNAELQEHQHMDQGAVHHYAKIFGDAFGLVCLMLISLLILKLFTLFTQLCKTRAQDFIPWILLFGLCPCTQRFFRCFSRI